MIPHLGPRKKYVVHYRNLKYYLEKGIKLEKIHRVLGFRQAKWLEKFISFNTSKRVEAKSQLLRAVFKLINVSVFGKTMENKRRRVNVKIVNYAKKALELICQPNCGTFHRLGKDLCTFVINNRLVYLDRPIYCGFTCLELSKLSMYKFHYDKIRKWYGDKAKLLMTDTDSLYYSVETDDIFLDMADHMDIFDTSGYDPHHPLYSEANKDNLGCMKDDAKGEIVEEFIGLCAKSYSLVGRKILKTKSKGIPKVRTKRYISHSVYQIILL